LCRFHEKFTRSANPNRTIGNQDNQRSDKNQILYVANDTKPLVSLLLCQRANRFSSQKQKIIIMKEKEKSKTVQEKDISKDDL
jgi:hypothetical protein